MTKLTRRDFVTNVAATTAAVTIVPRHVLGRGFTAPSDRLNIAGVGVGGMGKINLLNSRRRQQHRRALRRRLGLRRQGVGRRCDADLSASRNGCRRST